MTEREAVLEIEDLHVHFSRRREVTKAVDGVSLTLHRGETLGLVGESGCGKSSLVKTIFGINTPTSGTIRVFGEDLATLPARRRRQLQNRVQLVFQDPYSSLDPRLSAHDIVAEPLVIHHRYSKDRVVELLDSVGIGADALRKTPAQFSGGQRQRLGIARALALQPDVLVLDEPVSALDVSVQAQVVNLLLDLQASRGLSYLFIAHDLSVVRYLSDRVAVMRQGRIVETGASDEVFERPRDPYTRMLLDAIPIPDPHARPRPSPSRTTTT
ncbi:ATP-binding cassette domain-containing protein [Microbacterium sp. No. 7]|uniref:ATP-binding cassette domain-containing protein n=1 Tax=Microbacterium sp. No. 7 TaxID=1714373 RepID=UPI0006D23323|nr:ATP-binding cassette domain-containing protein [Microbacterium sp. No. 7]